MTHMTHRSGHKAKTDYKPHDVIIQEAEKHIRSYINDWPEDEWLNLSLTADLNLCLLDTKRGPVKRAAIYPVIEGKTQTFVWYRLFIKEALGDKTS